MSRMSFSFPVATSNSKNSGVLSLQAFTPLKEPMQEPQGADASPGAPSPGSEWSPSKLDDVEESGETTTVRSMTEPDSSPLHVSGVDVDEDTPPALSPPETLSAQAAFPPPADNLDMTSVFTSTSTSTSHPDLQPSSDLPRAPTDSIILDDDEDELPRFTSQFSSLPEDFDDIQHDTLHASSIVNDHDWQEMPLPDGPEPQAPTARQMDQYYKIADDFVLGSGLTSTVKLCTKINPLPGQSTEYAVKIINKMNANLDESLFQEEIKLLRKVRHKNIISLEDVFENEEYIFIVTELAYGGELFDKILEEQRLEEREARSLMFKIVDAVAYLHSWGIAHRDLKPENILFSTDKSNAEPKLMDFGFAQDLMNDYNALQAVNSLGTKGYAAPEVFSGDVYDEKCDVWSLGVITYILLSGRPPFISYEEDEDRPFWTYVNDMTNEPENELEFPPDLWRSVSDAAQHFCSVCLQVNPKKRARSRELLLHPWLKVLNPEQKKKAAYTRTFDKHDFKLATKLLASVSAIPERKDSPKTKIRSHVRSNSVEFSAKVTKTPAKP